MSLGYGDGEAIRFAFPTRKSKPGQQAELLKYARSLGVDFKTAIAVEKLMAEFGQTKAPKKRLSTSRRTRIISSMLTT